MESVLPPCRRTRRQRLTPAEPALPLQVLEEWVLLTAVIAARNTATNESNSRTEHCIPRYHWPYLTVLRFYVTCVAFGDPYPYLPSRRWPCRSSSHVYTTATPRSPNFQRTSTADYSQWVLNAAARLIYRKIRCEHVTPLLRELHWLRSRERVDFKLAIPIFRSLHGLAPRYLADDIRCVADTNRRRLRSSSSALLTVRPTRLVTMGDRAFPVADFGTLCRTTSPLLLHCLFFCNR